MENSPVEYIENEEGINYDIKNIKIDLQEFNASKLATIIELEYDHQTKEVFHIGSNKSRSNSRSPSSRLVVKYLPK